jgi:SAM-dependent methyltransferase
MPTELEPSTRSAPQAPPVPACRFCAAPLTTTFVDLGVSPLCENVVRPEALEAPETFFPLHVRVCDACLLVQLPEYVAPEDIFTEYAYFSSTSVSWVEHARRYAEAMVSRFGLGPSSRVVEIASNDGYLLQHFAERGIPVLGIEPASNVAATARERGIPTVNRFFGAATAADVLAEHGPADLIPANNVLAHVPDVNDFAAGVATLLAPGGVATFEFPHLLRMIEGNQFDTIYHEHFSYLSLRSAAQVLAAQGLRVVDVEELPTHGGSLRVFARHAAHDEPAGPRVAAVAAAEAAAGLDRLEGHLGFGARVRETKRELLEFLLGAQAAGRRVAGYGAPGKGNTLLNACGIRADLLEYTVDRNRYKQGTYLPGSRIPVHAPDHIAATKPDVILILPWNLREEIAAQLAYTREWGAQLVVPIPRVEVFPS